MIPQWIKYVSEICKFMGTGFFVPDIDILLKINKGELDIMSMSSREFLFPLCTSVIILFLGGFILKRHEEVKP